MRQSLTECVVAAKESFGEAYQPFERNNIFDDNTPSCYTHRTLEYDRSDPASLAILQREVGSYEVFPALWPVDKVLGSMHIKEEGIGFPVEEHLMDIYNEREWHSYVTHVRLKEV